MKLLRFLKSNIAALALVVFALGCLLLVAAVHIAPGAERYAYAPYAFAILQPDSMEELPINDYAGVRRSYVFTIPEGGVTGLQNVAERLALMCGGTLEIKSAAPRGTVVTVRIPHKWQPSPRPGESK